MASNNFEKLEYKVIQLEKEVEQLKKLLYSQGVIHKPQKQFKSSTEEASIEAKDNCHNTIKTEEISIDHARLFYSYVC